jgi:hypothetical protein
VVVLRQWSVSSFFEGALESRQTPFGLQPLRLTDRAMDFCHPALRTAHVAEATNGVRLQFQSELSEFEIEIMLAISERTAFALRAGATAPPIIDLLVDGALRDRRTLEHKDQAQKLRFEAAGTKSGATFELWLPHNVGTTVLSFSSDAPLVAAPDSRPRWIFHGSSITHDALAPGPSDTWPARLSRQENWHLTQLGFRGECHLDPGVAHSIAATPAEGIVLELGINVHNFQSFRQRTLIPAISGFLQTIREAHPSAPLIVISPLYGGEREIETSSVTLEGAEISGDLNLPAIREALRQAVATRVRYGDQSTFYIDGLELLGPDEASLFPDGLHPNHEGTGLLTERLAAKISSLNARA